MSRKDKRTTEEFLIELKESGNWNDDYDYSLVEYNGKTSKIIVLHKEFKTKHLFFPKDLLIGKKCSTRNLLGGKNGYKSVEDALKFIHSLKLKNTKEVGVASAISKNGKVYVVARYYPVGNYLGEYPY